MRPRKLKKRKLFLSFFHNRFVSSIITKKTHILWNDTLVEACLLFLTYSPLSARYNSPRVVFEEKIWNVLLSLWYMDNVILIFCDNRIYKTYKSHLRGHKLVTRCTSISIHKMLKHNSFFFHYVIEDSCNLFFIFICFNVFSFIDRQSFWDRSATDTRAFLYRSSGVVRCTFFSLWTLL